MTIRVPIVFGRGIVAIGVTLFAMFVLAFWLNWSGHRVLFWVPVTIIAVPCVCGALLAVVMQFGIARVLMKCPFCRAYGEMTNGYQEGHALREAVVGLSEVRAGGFGTIWTPTAHDRKEERLPQLRV